MNSFGRWDPKREMFGRLVCDMPDCLNKSDGSSTKTAFFKDLGPVVKIGELRKHVRCVVAKSERQAFGEPTNEAVDPA